MKKQLLILLCLPMIGFGQNVNIPDANFKAYLVGNIAINTNGDTEIQLSEATAFNGGIYCDFMNISDLTGIEAFTNLTVVECSENQITSIDLSANTDLTSIYCRDNQLTSIDVSQNLALFGLDCGINQLTSLNVSANTALINLDCGENQITTLDLSQNAALSYLECWVNQLTSLDLSNNTALTTLYCEQNQLTSIDVSNSIYLEAFSCVNNLLTSLDVSANTALKFFGFHNNQLTSLDVRNGNNTNLIYFNGTSNPNLTCINVDDVFYSTTIWANIDPQHYFSTNCPPSAIQELTINKELLKITDLLGRETKQTNQPLFYIFDDGTVEKRIVIE